MVRLKIAYWEFDFEAVCPTLDHDLLSQAQLTVLQYTSSGNFASFSKENSLAWDT